RAQQGHVPIIKDNFPEVIPEDYVKVEFKEGAHGTLKGTTKFLVKDGSAKTVLNAPTIEPNANYEAKKDANWDPAIPETFTGTEKNKKSFTFTAQYTYTGKDVVEQKPGDKKPDVPENFVKVEFKKGDHGVISSEYTTIYWVNSEENKTLANITKPTVTAFEGYKFTGWDKVDTEAIGKDGLTVTAQYKPTVVTEDPKDAEHYAKVDFVAGDQGKFEQVGGKDQVTTFWVLKKEDVKFNAPVVTANNGFVFSGWNPALQTKYTEDKTHTAKYEPKSDISDVPVAGFQEVKFMAGTDGNFGKGNETPITTKSVWVRPNVQVDLTTKAPKVIANKGKVHTGWKPSLIGTFTKSDTATEITAQYKTDADNNGVADEDETTPAPTAKALNVGKDPKSTTITGKAVPGAKVVAKTTIDNKEVVVGEATADNNGDYKIEAKKDNAALPKDTKVQVTAKVGEKQESKPTEAVVKEDKDGNGVDDDKEKFDIKKATKVEIIKNPDKMNYLVNTPEGKAKFETKGLVVKFTDDSGKSATYTAEELAKMNDVTIKPANNEEIGLKAEGKTNEIPLEITVNGKTNEVKPNVKVQLDADKNGKADEDEKSEQAKDVKALNQNKVVPGTNEVTDQPKDTTTVIGKAKPGSTVIIKNEEGKEIGKVEKVGDNGEFTVEVTKQDEGKKVKVVVTEPGKKDSDPVETTVVRDSDNDGEDDNQAGQTERPAAIASNIGKKPTFTTVKGKTEKGAVITVTVKVNGEERSVTVENLKVNNDGTYTLEAKYNNKPLESGAEILVYAKNEPKTISKPQTTTVFNDVNKDGKPDAGKVDLTDVKDIQVIAPDKMSYTQGEKLVGTGLKAVVRDNKGGIEIFDYDNATGKFKNADNEEVADITATVNGKAIKELALTEKEHNGKTIDVTIGDGEKAKTGSTNQTLEVKQLQTPTPTIEFAANQNTAGSTGQASGTAKQKTTVKFTVKNKPTTVYVKYTVDGEAKEETFEIGANDELTKTVDLAVKLPVGAEVQVLAKDADKTLSKPATATVVRDANNDGTADDKTPVGKTEIDPIKAESEKITVKPADNSTELVIKETDKSGNTPEGSKEITVTKDKDGNWKIGDTPVEKTEDGKLIIPTKDKLKLEEYNVVEVESKGDPDTTTPSNARATVGEAADTEAPATPKVDQPVDGDKDIKVKTPTEKDAKTITVEVEVPAKPGEQPTKKTVEVKKDDNGDWKVGDTPVKEENGKLVIPVDPAVKKGDKVTVEVADETGNSSKTQPQEVVERQQLPDPTINPIKTGEKTVAGKAEKAATVDIFKKNAEGKYEQLAKDVGVSPDGSYTYNNADGFKDGDVIRVVAKKDGWTPNNAEATVGVDTSALDKAITDGKGELDKRNDGTPADKDLEKAIQEGEDLKKRVPAPNQEEVNAAKDKIEKAIEEKKKTDEALDKLREAQKELDNAIVDAKKDRKPSADINDANKTNKDAKETIDNKGKDKNSEEINNLTNEVLEKIKNIRKPVLRIDIVRAQKDEESIQISTNPGDTIATVSVRYQDGSGTKIYKDIIVNPVGSASVKLEKPLQSGDYIIVKATRITNVRKVADYLDGLTPHRVN
ncbi:Ig-like domain-containing protein, partial [Peptostreptococcus anaerobius]|uniref:Ig-like domain-containing protein n=1 Tax=Peptostreptococcus anaerobius TaxID=1261 RepID=UPI0002A2D47F